MQSETLEQFNAGQTSLTTQLKVTKGRKLGTDGTLVESNIHAPLDSSLLVDSVQVLGRTLRRAKMVLAEQTSLSRTVFHNRIRSARKTARRVHRLIGRNKELGKQAYQKLLQITQKTVAQVKLVLQVLKNEAQEQAEQLITRFETFTPRAEQVIEQTLRRVCQDEKVPAEEKTSLFLSRTLPSSSVAKLANQSSMAAKSGWMKSKVASFRIGACSMAT